MSVDMISREVQKIKKKYKETDPFRLCRAMGILVLYAPMGSGNKCCKGFYLSQSRMRAVTVNSDMPPVFQRIITAHELGHAVLHTRSSGIKAFHDEVLGLSDSNTSFYEAASKLNVLPELLDFKLRVLKRKGYNIAGTPTVSDSTFLKNIKTAIRKTDD